MALSRSFKALGRIGGFFAAVWAVIGTSVSVLAGGPILSSMLTYGVLFGAMGGISGITTALLVVRGESGRPTGYVPPWRAVAWGFLGGFAPGAVFAGLALMGAGPSALPAPVVLGLVGGGIGGVLSGAAAALAKRAALTSADDQTELPAT